MTGDGPTVGAEEFARLTGVSRERLRTWERRHGFPVPRRRGGGPRRYAAADAAAVVSVRRAVDAGVPLVDAISAAAGAGAAAAATDAALAAAFDRLPTPAVLLNGPDPLRIAAANAAARAGGAMAGADVAADAAGTESARSVARLQRAFAGPPGSTTEVARPDWAGGGAAVPAAAIAVEAGDGPPLLLVADLEPAAAVEARSHAVELAAGLAAATTAAQRARSLLAAAAAAADAFREARGVDGLRAATELLVGRLEAEDAAIAPHMAGQLVLGRSVRGRLGPEMVTVAALPDLAETMRSGQAAWLEPDGAALAFGAPETLALLAAPVELAGETLGALLILFAEPVAIDTPLREFLAVAARVAGFALLQERLVDESHERQRGSGGGGPGRGAA